jgi:hypothetical protein
MAGLNPRQNCRPVLQRGRAAVQRCLAAIEPDLMSPHDSLERHIAPDVSARFDRDSRGHGHVWFQ